jgi:C-3',4' desaturase CrtD
LENASTLIIGAGYSGLATAAMLARRGHDICVLESHSLPGGCASFFQRGPYRFDVGATTLSGMAFDGPMYQLYRELDLKTPLIKQDIAMEIHSDEFSLRRFADHGLWLSELSSVFPKINCVTSWNRFRKWNEIAWKTLPHLHSFPARSLLDYSKLVFQSGFQGLQLAPALCQSIYSSLSKDEQKNKTYKKFLDEQLIISTQAHSHQVNALVGSLGLIYPSDTYYPMGGMAALAQELVQVIKDNGGRIIYRQEVETLQKDGQHFITTTKADRQFKSTRIISSVPGWNHLQIGPSKLESEMKQFNKRYPKAWGAMVGYFAVKLKQQPTCQYFQIHTQHQHPRLAHMKSLFFSLSHPEDRTRAPEGYQTVTVSTHCPDGAGLNRDQAEYHDLKNQYQEHIINVFTQYFKKYEIVEINTPEIATPLSFEHYTKRYLGRVGGLAHGNLWDLFSYPQQETSVAELYRMGDTVFPGQGVVGVIAGAQKLVHKIEKRGLP